MASCCYENIPEIIKVLGGKILFYLTASNVSASGQLVLLLGACDKVYITFLWSMMSKGSIHLMVVRKEKKEGFEAPYLLQEHSCIN